MAEPITFYQQWAAAWQQVDKYSTNPWCVDSENLDIFSDSQAIKWMPWSAKAIPSWDSWVDVDPKERFYLASDGRVYDSKEDVWYNHSFFDDNANIIDYDDWETAAQAVFWTPKKLYVAYDSDWNWKTISILTDRLLYNIYSDWIHISDWDVYGIRQWEGCKDSYWNPVSATSLVTNQTSGRTDRNSIKYSNTAQQVYKSPWGFHSEPDRAESFMKCKVKYEAQWSAFSWITIEAWKSNIEWNTVTKNFEYDTVWNKVLDISDESIDLWLSKEYEFYYDNFITKRDYWWGNSWIYFHGTCESPDAFVNVRYYKKEDWTYLYPKDRKIIDIEDETYIEVDATEYEQLAFYALEDQSGNTYYQLTQVNTINFPDDTQIVAFARGFDYQYIFANKWDIWIVYYATDVNLATWDIWWRFPWTKFINAILIWNYAYVIAEKRWIRGLYIFSQWDMKLLVWADKKYTESESLIDWKEIYNFTWIMANWRDRVVCATDNTVFMWWRNKLWANVWAFVLKVDWGITDINTKRWYLDVYFTKNQVNYRKSIQDDVNIVHHESDWSVTYPIQINTHLIEKEPMKMEVSYNLPNSSTQLDVYINVNDYYFWTFESDTQAELTAWDKFKLVWCWWNYWLIFVEKIWNLLTFYLDGDLPYQVNNTKQIISEDTNTTINFTALNHFKHIWSCTKDSEYYPEWKYTILNITERNKLPIVRKLQVKIEWTNTGHSSPELYAIRLLSNQFDK